MGINFKYKLIETPDFIQIRDTFCEELRAASKGRNTSIPFIQNHLPQKPLISVNETFQVFSIGGTSGQIAKIRYLEDGDVEILEHSIIETLPKFTTVDIFLDFLDKNFDKELNTIGLNFAFTLVPEVSEKGELDGIMISGDTKGHAFIGLQDKLVGKTIKNYFKDKYGKDLVVSVGNDTVCLMASAIKPGINKNNIAAGIVGTGYNLAFFLDNNTIVNTQAADFKSFTQTESGKIVDLESTNIGEQLYNKEIAGGELYKHFNALIPILNLNVNELSSTKQLSDIALSGVGQESEVAIELLDRSATFVATHLAGIYMYKNYPQKLSFIMEGSLFWDAPNYKEILTKRLSQLGARDDHIEFLKIENSDLIGASKLITG